SRNSKCDPGEPRHSRGLGEIERDHDPVVRIAEIIQRDPDAKNQTTHRERRPSDAPIQFPVSSTEEPKWYKSRQDAEGVEPLEVCHRATGDQSRSENRQKRYQIRSRWVIDGSCPTDTLCGRNLSQKGYAAGQKAKTDCDGREHDPPSLRVESS